MLWNNAMMCLVCAGGLILVLTLFRVLNKMGGE